MSYRHTPDMGPISGVGGVYEETCQRMLETGVEWMLERPGFEFLASGYQDAIGLVYADNQDTQELMDTIISAVNREANGAQVHDVMQRLGYIRHHGWNDYAEVCRKRHAGQLVRQIQ
jgi:hypothetical protein